MYRVRTAAIVDEVFYGANQIVTGAIVVAIVCGVVSCGDGERLKEVSEPHDTSMGVNRTTSDLFAPDSVWNAPLSPEAPIDPSSHRLVAGLLKEVSDEQRNQEGPWIETESYSTTVYRVPANQPNVQVRIDNSEPWARTLKAALRNVPIPPDARPATGSDAHMTIWQPSTDRLWETWKTSRKSDGWHAQWGGAIRRVSQSLGYYSKNSWPGARTYWGATATSLPVIAGTMTISELRQGSINHALAIDLPSARKGVYAWPAQRTDGEDPSSTAIPEGAHLRLSPRLDIPSLGLPAMTQEMALAAQRFGMIVRDQTHHAIGFYAEDPAPLRFNPYPALMEGVTPAELLADFPWSSVEVLQMDLRKGTGRPSSGS